MKAINSKHLLILVGILAMATLPWLGVADFYTKGEPREAIVAQTMLQQGNWILPHNNGGEMAYKPPFFHWCIATVSSIMGGVNEWTARFPSALTSILLMAWTYIFYARRKDSQTALLTALVCASTFEMYRAAYACRVDMVLTFCIVGAMLALYGWADTLLTKGPRRTTAGYYLLAVLMMSLGCLTKGPVAVILPCGTAGLFLLLRKQNLFKAAAYLGMAALLSLILPAMWYYAAYQQGGDTFLQLVKEENIDRFLGKMTYASHENGLWYYFVMLPAGLLPWTLPLLWGLKDLRIDMTKGDAPLWKRLWHKTEASSNLDLYSVVAAVIVFVFYCIPKSKRGVYIMPMYPFLAYHVAIYLQRAFSAKTLRYALATSLTLFTIAFGIIVPLSTAKKSDLKTAREVEKIVGKEYLTSYFANNVKGNPTHFFTINYYLNDRVDIWENQKPETGYVLMNVTDEEIFREENKKVVLEKVDLPEHKSCDTRQIIGLYRYILPASSMTK